MKAPSHSRPGSIASCLLIQGFTRRIASIRARPECARGPSATSLAQDSMRQANRRGCPHEVPHEVEDSTEHRHPMRTQAAIEARDRHACRAERGCGGTAPNAKNPREGIMKSKTNFKLASIAAAVLAAAMGQASAAPIAAGDLVLYRVGAGSAGLTNAATQVFLDEYTTGGSLVQSIALPTSVGGGNFRLTASGTATSEGELTLSGNGQYLVLTGYDAAVGTASIAGTTASSVNRTIGLVDIATGNVNTTTHLSDAASGNNIRSATSSNGTDLWVAGAAGGVRYTTLGGTTSTQLSTTVTNIRQVEIFGGQLYASDSSGTTNRLGTVGTGLPTTSGQTIANLPGLPTSTGSPYAFFFADLSRTVAGLDTLYLADDGVGITKYSFDGATWTAKGTVGAAADLYRGLTGVVNGNDVQLFATGQGGSGAAGGGKLVSILDTSGYDGSFNATANLLATAAGNTAFRGLAIVPVPEADAYLMMLIGLGAVGFMARRGRI